MHVPGYNTLRDGRDAFLYVGGTLAHVNARLREEIATIDPEQAAKLHPLKEVPQEAVPGEKQKTKTRVVRADFNIKDYLNFNKLKIMGECNNELGHCIRLSSCPIKNEPHAGHNETTCNFIYPAKDGGLAFHCFSTGCEDSAVHDVIKLLAERNGVYPKGIYEEKPKGERQERVRKYKLLDSDPNEADTCVWLWPGYLQANQLTHLAGLSAEGKSPVTRDLAARLSSGREWPDGTPNTFEKRMVLMLASEDDWATVILPHLMQAGANLDNIKRFAMTTVEGDSVAEALTALDQDIGQLEECLKDNANKVGMIVIDPITNYLGRVNMNKEGEARGLLMPLANLAQRYTVATKTVGHLNKSEGPLLQRVMGAAAFVGVARQTLFFSGDPEDECQFAHVMGFGRKTTTPGLKYKTVQKPFEFNGKTFDVVAVEWGGKSDVDMEEQIGNPTKQAEKSASKQVQVLLKTLLRDGEKPSQEVEQSIKESGINITDWQKAAKRVAKSKKKGKGWVWYLPVPEQAEFDSLKNNKEVTA